jgi:hypothetical protein
MGVVGKARWKLTLVVERYGITFKELNKGWFRQQRF